MGAVCPESTPQAPPLTNVLRGRAAEERRGDRGELVQLEEDPTLDDIRLRAADLALDIALRDSDPFTADVVEALLADLPPQTSASVVKDLRDKATEARATRRAIAQSFGSRSQSNPASAPSQQTNQRTGFSGGF